MVVFILGIHLIEDNDIVVNVIVRAFLNINLSIFTIITPFVTTTEYMILACIIADLLALACASVRSAT
jgi:hypothetical protein